MYKTNLSKILHIKTVVYIYSFLIEVFFLLNVIYDLLQQLPLVTSTVISKIVYFIHIYLRFLLHSQNSKEATNLKILNFNIEQVVNILDFPSLPANMIHS